MSRREGNAPDTGFATERDPKLRLLIPLVVAVAFLMEQLDTTIITTAIPDMARSLHATPVQMNLAVTAYVLTLAVFIPVSGWIADRFGARRVFTAALAIFTLGSIACGIASSFPMLVATRAIQGFGGAMMTPVGRLILLRSFPRRDLVTAMTYTTLPAILGPVIGPLLGGLLTTYASWRWIFFVNIPFGVAGIVLALRFVADGSDERPARFDLPGFLMVGAAMALIQFGLENVGRPWLSGVTVVAILFTALLLLAGFAVYARRAVAPAVDLGLFRFRTFAVGTLAGGLCRVGLNGAPFLLPLMLQVGFGFSPLVSGALTFLSSLGAVPIRLVAGRLLRWFGFRGTLVGSAICGTLALGSFALLEPGAPRWVIGLVVLLFGLTRATQFMTSNTLSYADLPGPMLSRATSVGGMLQQLSVSFGVSFGAVLLTLVSSHDAVLTPARFHVAFLLSALIPLLPIPGFLLLKPADGAEVSGHREAQADERGDQGRRSFVSQL